jgi:glycosyltransferase involved in cell wall biosynthesis
VFVQFAISAVSVNFWSVWSACKGFARAHVPIVVAFHEPVREYDLLGVVTRGLYRSMARVTNVPIAFSFAGAQALRESGLFKQVVELPHGTTGPSEVGGSDVARVRERYGVKKPLVLVLGYTSPDKGTDVLLDAVPAIVKAQGNVAQFIIAGAPRKRRGIFRVLGKRDVAHLRHLRDQASRLSNVDVTFYGFVADEDVNALLYMADVVALPYRRITQSGIANLAISSRSVIVSSDLPGLRSDLGDAAKYVRVADAEDLASAILELLDPSAASLRERMRELSAERAIENTFAKVAEKIVSAASEYGAAQRL